MNDKLIGTSSLRRLAGLKYNHPNMKFENIKTFEMAVTDYHLNIKLGLIKSVLQQGHKE